MSCRIMRCAIDTPPERLLACSYRGGSFCILERCYGSHFNPFCSLAAPIQWSRNTSIRHHWPSLSSSKSDDTLKEGSLPLCRSAHLDSSCSPSSHAAFLSGGAYEST